MKNLRLLFMLLVASCAFGASAYDFEVDGMYYGINFDGTTVYVAYKSSSGDDYSGDVVIPSSVTYEGTTYIVREIGERAFYYCKRLTSVEIPSTVMTIAQGAFYKCTGLTSVEIPFGVITIGDLSFCGCTGLTSVTIPYSVNKIDDAAFSGCTGLTSVEIPNSVMTIGIEAFGYCTGLTSIEIPNSVDEISGGAFTGCTNLTTVISKALTPPNLTGDGFEETTYSNAPLYVPAASLQTYQSTKYWSSFTTIKPIGDMDGDGVVGVDDVTALIALILSGDTSTVNVDVLDMDGDGVLGVDDVTALINVILGNE